MTFTGATATSQQMAPLVEAFHPARLQQHVQYHANGKNRKPAVDLKQCELKELFQYECNLNGPKQDPRSQVVCDPILRLFRKYVALRSDCHLATRGLIESQVCGRLDGRDYELGRHP